MCIYIYISRYQLHLKCNNSFTVPSLSTEHNLQMHNNCYNSTNCKFERKDVVDFSITVLLVDLSLQYFSSPPQSTESLQRAGRSKFSNSRFAPS